jgi:hypothetical protein
MESSHKNIMVLEKQVSFSFALAFIHAISKVGIDAGVVNTIF